MTNGFTKAIAFMLVVILIACTTPTPEQDLQAAVVLIDLASTLPNLNSVQKTWITTAASGLTCSSVVLAKNEVATQEGIDITACFANLPVVPVSDQPYIQTAIASIDVFLILFGPQIVKPVAIKANADIRSLSPDNKLKVVAILTTTGAKASTVRQRVIATSVTN